MCEVGSRREYGLSWSSSCDVMCVISMTAFFGGRCAHHRVCVNARAFVYVCVYDNGSVVFMIFVTSFKRLIGLFT